MLIKCLSTRVAPAGTDAPEPGGAAAAELHGQPGPDEEANDRSAPEASETSALPAKSQADSIVDIEADVAQPSTPIASAAVSAGSVSGCGGGARHTVSVDMAETVGVSVCKPATAKDEARAQSASSPPKGLAARLGAQRLRLSGDAARRLPSPFHTAQALPADSGKNRVGTGRASAGSETERRSGSTGGLSECAQATSAGTVSPIPFRGGDSRSPTFHGREVPEGGPVSQCIPGRGQMQGSSVPAMRCGVRLYPNLGGGSDGTRGGSGGGGSISGGSVGDSCEGGGLFDTPARSSRGERGTEVHSHPPKRSSPLALYRQSSSPPSIQHASGPHPARPTAFPPLKQAYTSAPPANHAYPASPPTFGRPPIPQPPPSEPTSPHARLHSCTPKKSSPLARFSRASPPPPAQTKQNSPSPADQSPIYPQAPHTQKQNPPADSKHTPPARPVYTRTPSHSVDLLSAATIRASTPHRHAPVNSSPLAQHSYSRSPSPPIKQHPPPPAGPKPKSRSPPPCFPVARPFLAPFCRSASEPISEPDPSFLAEPTPPCTGAEQSPPQQESPQLSPHMSTALLFPFPALGSRRWRDAPKSRGCQTEVLPPEPSRNPGIGTEKTEENRWDNAEPATRPQPPAPSALDDTCASTASPAGFLFAHDWSSAPHAPPSALKEESTPPPCLPNDKTPPPDREQEDTRCVPRFRRAASDPIRLPPHGARPPRVLAWVEYEGEGRPPTRYVRGERPPAQYARGARAPALATVPELRRRLSAPESCFPPHFPLSPREDYCAIDPSVSPAVTPSTVRIHGQRRAGSLAPRDVQPPSGLAAAPSPPSLHPPPPAHRPPLPTTRGPHSPIPSFCARTENHKQRKANSTRYSAASPPLSPPPHASSLHTSPPCVLPSHAVSLHSSPLHAPLAVAPPPHAPRPIRAASDGHAPAPHPHAPPFMPARAPPPSNRSASVPVTPAGSRPATDIGFGCDRTASSAAADSFCPSDSNVEGNHRTSLAEEAASRVALLVSRRMARLRASGGDPSPGRTRKEID
jgi:hypothetical protein